MLLKEGQGTLYVWWEEEGRHAKITQRSWLLHYDFESINELLPNTSQTFRAFINWIHIPWKPLIWTRSKNNKYIFYFSENQNDKNHVNYSN